MRTKTLANLGDVNPLDHGGFLVRSDGEIVDIHPRDEDRKIEVHWFSNALCYPIEGGGVSDNEFHKDHPAWFSDGLGDVARSADHEDIAEDLCSDDPVVRARAYQSIAAHWGIVNFDQYPITLTRTECRRMYNL
tara:strand:+ start:1156 stop:1557 length:402 start_codon:yes stop_codon:yes gene_type:complete